MSQPQPPPSSPSILRLKRAETLMDEILAHKGQASLHRSNMRLIEIQLDCAQVALGDFLEHYFQQRHQVAEQLPLSSFKERGQGRTAVAGEVKFQCPKCQRPFKSQAALSGHGPDRCKKTHNS